jgi:2,2-dialkylglycine decarboxylase (pyruvate)
MPRARLCARDVARLRPDAGRRGAGGDRHRRRGGACRAARSRGEYLLARLGELQERHEHIGDVRGLGLLCGLELVEDRDTREPADALGLALTDECQRCGLSINLVRGGTGGQASCLRMAPPLTVAEDEIDLAVTIIDEALQTVTDRRAAGVSS